MSNRTLPAAIVAVLTWLLPAFPCTIARAPIWAKNPKSSTPLFRVVIDGKAGYIDQNGRMVIAPKFDPSLFNDASSGDFMEGLAVVSVNRVRQLIDETGRAQKFEGLELDAPFSESLTSAGYTSEGDRSRRVLLVDRAGSIMARVDAYWVEPFSEGLAAFAGSKPKSSRDFGHRRGYIDRRGNVVIRPQYAYAGPFSQGLAAVAMDGHCWVAGHGASRFPAPSAMMQITSCGPAPADSVTQPCRHGYIDNSGKLVIAARYELAEEFSEGLAAVRQGGKWGFIDRQGTEVTPFQFDEVRAFAEGKAAVRIKDKWGYCNRLGVVVIGPQFDSAFSFSQGLAAVRSQGDYHYINGAGVEALPGRYLQATPFVQGLAHVRMSETKWAWIDASGKVVFSYDWKQGY